MENIFQPIKLGKTSIKNRICFPAMCHNYLDEEGVLNRRLKEFIAERVKGGAGLIITPGNPYGKNSKARLSIASSDYFQGWHELNELVNSYDSRLFCQLHPAAPQASRRKNKILPVDLTLDDINYIVNSYTLGAINAKIIGLGGVEIHGAHAHEVAQFMSPYYNYRNDEYGGNTINRSRFAQEIVTSIKEACGDDFPVIFRISGSEKIDGGREVEETAEIAALLCEAGVDAIHVSVGLDVTDYWISSPMDIEKGFNVNDAAYIKQEIDKPVIAVGRITDLTMAEQIINEKKADIVAMGRALLADPYLPEKAIKNQLIVPCIGCNQGCRQSLKEPIYCLQNPRVGREDSLFYNVSPEKRKALIVGAGPAGLEAAITLQKRGHKATIFEKEKDIGGLIRIASLPPYKMAMNDAVAYREAMANELGVEIVTEQEVTPDLVKKFAPSIVIIASGSVPIIPNIKGINLEGIYTADEVLRRAELVGERIAVIGGGLVGCEVADFLAALGKSVIIIESLNDIAIGLSQSRKHFLVERLKAEKVEVLLESTVEEIKLPELLISRGHEFIKIDSVDSVVLAVGRKPVNDIQDQLRMLDQAKIFVIGDANKPGLAIDAIYEAAKLGSSI